MWLRLVNLLPCHPSGLIPFPFGFSPVRLVKMAFFFFCFFVLKIFFEREIQNYNQHMQDTPCIYGSG
jgi:hypothetical protein|tara:strand:- start:13003 stop:13203 length:201 start_codon:yes stop_codon:yes gene_type:complete